MFYWLHVKWFVNFEELTKGRVLEFTLTDPAVQIGLGFVLLVLLLLFFLNKKVKTPAWVSVLAARRGRKIFWLFKILIGLFLLVTAYENVLFAPIFIVDTLVEKIISVASVLTALLLIFDYRTWLAGSLLLLIYFSGGFLYGFIEMLEHVHLLGVALFLLLLDWRWGRPSFLGLWSVKSLDVLRVFTGIALIVLAWVEKLSYPILAEEFLKIHDWNFFDDFLGLTWLSDHYFVVFAGMIELMFGLIFILGWMVRLNTIALAMFFVSTAIVLGPHEVVGHLPVFAIAILFLLWGKPESGFKVSQR